MRLKAQLQALLLLTVLCGVNVAQEVQEDEGQFDRFLMATAECKTCGTKLSRVSCIIEQVSSPVQCRNISYHFNWQVDLYVMDKFTPSAMVQRSESTIDSWKNPGSSNTALSVSKSLERLHSSMTRVARSRLLGQRKLLATGVLPMPTSRSTPATVEHDSLTEVTAGPNRRCMR